MIQLCPELTIIIQRFCANTCFWPFELKMELLEYLPNIKLDAESKSDSERIDDKRANEGTTIEGPLALDGIGIIGLFF